MDESRRAKSNPLKKKIEQAIRRTGFDENFISAAKFHLEVIYSKIDESNITSEYDYCNLLMSKLFIDKMDMYPTKRFKCQVNECSAWPIPLLPSEVFSETKLSDEYRISSFYECLQVGQVLDCRVASVLPNEYQLRVIHKYGTTRILDDLNIIVVMLRSQSELFVLQKELLTCELVRVIVSEINKDKNERKIYVTVRDNIEELKQNRPQIGRLPEEHLPTYVLDPPDPELFQTYSDYLKSLSAFRNPILLNGILEGFGIDPRGVYTFYPVCESLKPVDANAVLKESNLYDVKHHADLALQELENGNLENALSSAQMAIKIYPVKNQTSNDKVELGKLHEIKERIYTEIEQKSKISKLALTDWKLAYIADPTNESVNKHLSKVFFLAANKHYKMADYSKAAEWSEASYKLNKNNAEALALFEHLKSKHPEVFVNLDEESLLSLQEKKMELVTQLRKILEYDGFE